MGGTSPRVAITCRAIGITYCTYARTATALPEGDGDSPAPVDGPAGDVVALGPPGLGEVLGDFEPPPQAANTAATARETTTTLRVFSHDLLIRTLLNCGEP